MNSRDYYLSISRDHFYNASMLIYNTQKDNVNFWCALIVNQALTCELSIKTILEKLKIKYTNIHSLYNLFQLLPQEIQIEIVNNISKSLNHPPESVWMNIQLFLFSCVDWRYLDKTMIIETSTLHQFMLALYNCSRKYVAYVVKEREEPLSENELQEIDNKFAEYTMQALNDNAKRIDEINMKQKSKKSKRLK